MLTVRTSLFFEPILVPPWWFQNQASLQYRDPVCCLLQVSVSHNQLDQATTDNTCTWISAEFHHQLVLTEITGQI